MSRNIDWHLMAMIPRRWKKAGALLMLTVLSGFLLVIWSSTYSVTSSVDNPNTVNVIRNRIYNGKPGISSSAVHIMISADSTNLQGMIAAINSVVCNTKRKVFFHLITLPELTNHLRSWILKTKLASIAYNIKSFPSSGKHDGSNNSSDCVNTSCTRFKLPLLLPELGHDKVVHLSSDCIVQGDLSELEQVPLKPGTFAAFSDDCTSVSKQHFLPEQNKYIGHLKLLHPTLRGLRLRPSTCSFDAAVFVASANSWLRYNITNQLEFWHQVAQREDLHAGNTMENDAAKISMLLTFHRRITVLPPLWNVRHIGVSAGSRYSLEFLKKAKLLQWDGPFKPWGRRSSYTELWEKYFIPDPLGKFKLVRKYGSQVQTDNIIN